MEWGEWDCCPLVDKEENMEQQPNYCGFVKLVFETVDTFNM